jgi:hypothetical protein
MGEASKLDDYLDDLASQPLPPEVERLDPRPKLRIAHDALARALGPNATVHNVLEQVSNGNGATVLHDATSDATAVVVPADEYLELVTSQIKDRGLAHVTSDGRALPSDATLNGFGVEQVDPAATWLHIGRIA